MKLIAAIYEYPKCEDGKWTDGKWIEKPFTVRRDASLKTKCRKAIQATERDFVKFKYIRYGILTDGIGELFLYGIDADGNETRVEMIDAKNGNFYYG